ncbi:Adenylosuccinate [Hortaea werneckii]|uniref:Adenylosuccinate synthetase n=1 Tax=Hortaea werneckii TaxID=91943 RepID=A0A3M7FV42_HORWE|nr:Adenylosuccinate [Hortaea werneckii]KAI7000734.1 Adenylosuccinate [Hortaea werneckii]KAI7148621.1 Adenylosuccinate [Hortaea werneckii]KAI7179844.1 Adenylosuccinate [Hortaea werneckii]KAI7195530.1 Adenylosuccinate [Hortaea werneckii]
MATIVLGAQWGDEGKGKIVDVLSEDIQLCCRAQGGHNAGHTIVKGGTTFDVHILPSGVLTEGCVSLIGSGCVVYVPGFFKELKMLETHGIATKDRILLSDRCHVDLDLHTKVDGLEEVELGQGSIGTTGKGIGPTYSTKATRSGVRVADIFNKEYFDEKVRHLADGYQKRYGNLLSYDVEEELKRFDDYRELLKPFVVDQVPLIESAVKGNVRMLVEGANALMLDIDNGTYPYVTSSNTGLGGIFTGLHLSPRKVKEVIGVVKAYTTRVGGGPFPSEQLNEYGERLQSVGKEFGVTTGRKRRCGWLDLVLVKFSHTINWYDCFNLTKLDILDDFDEIKVATEYRYKGEKLASFPADLHVLDNMEVIYQTFPGWKSKTVGLKKFEELPVNARKYIEFIEEFTGVKCKYIGTGPGQESMIVR